MAFTEKDIRKDPAALDELMQMGARATPVTVIEDGGERQVVLGFDRGKIQRLIGG